MRGLHNWDSLTQSKANFLRGLGADEVIDYTSTRFEDKVRDIDVVFDAVGGGTLDRSWGVVRKGGTLVTIVGDVSKEKAKECGINAASFLVKPDREELTRLSNLIDEGTIHPVIETVLPLAKARQAYERGLLGHNRGKIVLKVMNDEK